MNALIVAACIAAGILGIGAVWLILRREDTRPLSVPGRDAPESPAPTGPPGSDPQWWLKGEPGIPAGDSNVPPGDTAVPAPASLPEGDEPAARPPQEAPAREPSPDPLTAARNAMAAVARLEPGEYLKHLDDATGYGDDGSLWNWVSDATIARGFPPITDEVA